MLSAASARSPRGLLKLTLILLAAGALVAPALGSRPERNELAAPAGLEVVEATGTSLAWRWEPDERAESYRVYEDDRLVGSTTSPGFTLDGLDCGRGYVLGVEAVDADGRRSERTVVIAPSAPCPAPEVKRPASPPDPPAAQPPGPTQSEQTVQPPHPVAPEPTNAPVTPPSIWQTAGVFVWHEAAVDPETLGREMKDNGFGWVAVQLHDGLSVDPVEDDWVARFRAASGGLPVGGWGVLRTDPVGEAQLAESLVQRNSLDFYIADAEAEYKYSSDTGYSGVRYARSHQFVDTFRAGLPDLPAAVSSYCRADREDIDWQSWADGGFDFLPQAYVNDLGGYVTPEACTDGASKWFPADAVHPTIGIYKSHVDDATPDAYTRLLAAAHTIGFSVYLAETQQKDPQGWDVYGNAIKDLGIARVGGGPIALDPGAEDPPQQPSGAS